MRKYGICLLLSGIVAAVGISAGFLAHEDRERTEFTVPETEYETESSAENQLVVNQRLVAPVPETEAEQYYLVSETGYLLVFSNDQSTICLYTHIPITDFPEKEQERLREGIWFPSMMEVFQYLESYTS